MLLGLVLLGGLGVAAGGWRRANPEVAERIERFDADDATPVATSTTPNAPPAPRRPGPGPPSSAAAPPSAPAPRTRPAKLTAGDGPLDLNRATQAELLRLPGVGPALADRILAAREETGRFASIDELRRVPGIGAVKLERLRPLLIVDESTIAPKTPR